jgi:hypothetical protein
MSPVVESLFLGHTFKYWNELNSKAEAIHDGSLYLPRLLEEIAELRGKVSFYEARVKESHAFMEAMS